MSDEQIAAQARLDKIDSELKELYRQVSEKEDERDKFDRVVHPEDYPYK